MTNDFNKTNQQKNMFQFKIKHLENTEPTRTLYISDLSKNISDSELKHKLSLSDIKEIFRSSDHKCIFIELSEHKHRGLNFKNCDFNVKYSKLSINEIKNFEKLNTNRHRTKVLYFRIDNASYSITVDVLKKICSAYGKINKLCVGPKNVKNETIEALVEFNSISDAENVKDNLDGNDIYSNCCNLTVKFSVLNSLLIDKNDSENFDIQNKSKVPLLESPETIKLNKSTILPSNPTESNYRNKSINEKLKKTFMIYQGDPTIREISEGLVLKITNLNPKLTTKNVFNWFCLYGNVVKIYKDSETSALVQMSNKEGAHFARCMLNGIHAFNKTMEVKQTNMKEIINVEPIADYQSHPHNRFRTPLQAGKPFRVYAPSQTIHFFNVPESYRAQTIAQVFIKLGAPEPEKVVVFPRKPQSSNDNPENNDSSPSSSNQHQIVSGLVEYDTCHEALEAISMANHSGLHRNSEIQFNNNNKNSNNKNQVCHMRIVFSPVRISEQHAQKTIPTTDKKTSPSSANKRSGLKRTNQSHRSSNCNGRRGSAHHSNNKIARRY